jgi:hypothetical protein
MTTGLALKVAIKAEHEAGRLGISPLTKLWSWPWSSIRDTEQVVLTQHMTAHDRTLPYITTHHHTTPLVRVSSHQVIAVLGCSRPIVQPYGNRTHRVQIQFQTMGMEFGKSADANPINVKQ